jgi:pyrimidine deaminase RibD-like protein
MNREQYMQRCLQLASLGLGYVHTNPLVGAVATGSSAKVIMNVTGQPMQR